MSVRLQIDDYLDSQGYTTIRNHDGSPEGDIDSEPIATVYDARDARLIVQAVNEREGLLDALRGMVGDAELLECDEGISACFCMAKAPDDITAPPPCAYCRARALLERAR